ncbi:MAG TPA: CBS domain-containing protein [Polyangiaceae bacterium]|nr:CBS domain-containing protein [Polyangiaceae bacterium]
MPKSRSKGVFPQAIRRFMTPTPHSIGRDQPLSLAQERMRTLGIRHLPVLDGGKLVGVLSQRDAWFVETLPDVDPTRVPVEDAMSTDVYVVPPDALVEEVAAEMADRKYGCAVIAEGSQIVGIFTTVDALRALVEAQHATRHDP